MSDSVLPHRRQPTRLRRPWDSPGKNTGVGSHFLLQCIKDGTLFSPAVAHGGGPRLPAKLSPPFLESLQRGRGRPTAAGNSRAGPRGNHQHTQPWERSEFAPSCLQCWGRPLGRPAGQEAIGLQREELSSLWLWDGVPQWTATCQSPPSNTPGCSWGTAHAALKNVDLSSGVLWSPWEQIRSSNSDRGLRPASSKLLSEQQQMKTGCPRLCWSSAGGTLQGSGY